MLKVMYATTKPILEITYNIDTKPPLPAVGDDVEINETRYRVRSRVWSLTGPALSPGNISVAIILTEF